MTSHLNNALLRRHRAQFPDDHGGLITVISGPEVRVLATYNAEVGKGWLHTPEHRWLMEILQWRFNAATREAILDAGGVPLPGGGGYIGACQVRLKEHIGWSR